MVGVASYTLASLCPPKQSLQIIDRPMTPEELLCVNGFTHRMQQAAANPSKWSGREKQMIAGNMMSGAVLAAMFTALVASGSLTAALKAAASMNVSGDECSPAGEWLGEDHGSLGDVASGEEKEEEVMSDVDHASSMLSDDLDLFGEVFEV
jgi:hypothetical protein